MKELFFEYFPIDNADKKNLWDTGTFVFDTNILLNLYRYTSKTREALIGAIDSFKGRIWLPYQVAYEFSRRRCDVIYETVDRYLALNNAKSEFLRTITNSLRLNNGDKELISLGSFIEEWITKEKEEDVLVSNPSDDQILSHLFTLFEGRTGSPITEEIRLKLEKEGENRFEHLIPPGFKDAGKGTVDNANNRYGDFFIWKEIIEYSKLNNTGIIFITGDQKPDWWYVAKGRTIGPRPELIKEFFSETSNKFYMYNMEGFISAFQENKGPIEKDVIEELKNMESYKINSHTFLKALELYSPIKDSQNINNLDYQIKGIDNKIFRQRHYIEQVLAKYGPNDIPDDIKVILSNTEINIQNLHERKKKLEKKLNNKL